MPIAVHKNFHKLLNRILSKDRFLLTTHIRPDPDGWGAELGLNYLLTSKNKNSIIFNHNPYEGVTFADIANFSPVFTNDQDFDRSTLENRTVISLDNSSIERLGAVARYVKSDHSNLIVIDHHDGVYSNDPGFFMFPEASATSEIVYILLVLAGVAPSLEVAQALYAGLVVDSGNFQHAKTSSLTHRVAARLLKSKVRPAEVSEALYARFTLDRLKTRQIVYNTLQTVENGQIIWFALDTSVLEAENISLENLDGLIDQTFEVKEVRIAILFSQRSFNFTRVALRARHGLNLLPIVGKYGGGGHRVACGVGLDMRLEEAVKEIIPLAKQCLL